jgi:hypothetical protein
MLTIVGFASESTMANPAVGKSRPASIFPNNGQPDRFTWTTSAGGTDYVIACAGGDAS